ncbi:YdiU family protein [Aciduricibacillus chroicocephali]|uniref:Protein nucleotidyltransferase YdiU n=1 Tax=Aciduricibacillus chroicocephali TaxID=3054939 RepID=A0ABY9KUX6_9BACI|nr:YdiU family protein [Bacillaceae bacterium 44XB]
MGNETGWNFDNSYARLPETFFKPCEPTPVKKPEVVKLNVQLAQELGLDAALLNTKNGTDILAGNALPEGAEPIAQAYAGHQFGGFNKLGDGRAILLGEQITPEGERFDIQLKGPGKTPYSRGGDGRAALGPMLREYIISEAMYALGIPTTRSLAVVSTGQPTFRGVDLPGAILTRVAASHLRVGTFQYAAAFCEVDELRALADYTIERHYPDAKEDENPYFAFLKAMIDRQAKLIASWQHIGFIHGVQNTDNVTVSGETIDYGPCAFMDVYDPATVFSSIDRVGRYAYGNQPPIGNWNLARFAETLVPLLADDEKQGVKLAEEAIGTYPERFYTYWLEGMRKKLGFFNEEKEDETLIDDLLEIMKKYRADYTNTFVALTTGCLEGMVLFATAEFKEWHKRWQERLGRQPESDKAALERMKSCNPAVIPRNHRVEAALDAAEKGDLSVMEELLVVLAKPFAYSEDQAEYQKVPASAAPYTTYCGT